MTDHRLDWVKESERVCSLCGRGWGDHGLLQRHGTIRSLDPYVFEPAAEDEPPVEQRMRERIAELEKELAEVCRDLSLCAGKLAGQVVDMARLHGALERIEALTCGPCGAIAAAALRGEREEPAEPAK